MHCCIVLNQALCSSAIELTFASSLDAVAQHERWRRFSEFSGPWKACEKLEEVDFLSRGIAVLELDLGTPAGWHVL